MEAFLTDTRKGTAANWIRPQNCITAFCCSETVNTGIISGSNSYLFLKHQGPGQALHYTVLFTYHHYRNILHKATKQKKKLTNAYDIVSWASSHRWPSFLYNSSGSLVSGQLQLRTAFRHPEGVCLQGLSLYFKDRLSGDIG